MFLQRSILRRRVVASAGDGRKESLLGHNIPCLVCIAARGTSRALSHRFLVTETKDKIETLKEKTPWQGETFMATVGKEEAPMQIRTSTTSSPEATAAATGDILDASFADRLRSEAKTKRGGQSGIFPWRSSPKVHDRLVPGTPENYSKGLLLGGNLTSSNPKMDGFATACFFLRIPFWDMVLFRNATEQDLADSMAWAFGAAVQQIATGERTHGKEIVVDGEKKNNGEFSLPTLKDMMEERKLAKLFESASKFGRESLEVNLETKPILYSEGGIEAQINANGVSATIDELPISLRDGPKIVSLFVFPFFSREQAHNGDPHHLRKYSKLLDAISASNDEDAEAANSSYANSLELSRDLMEDFRQKGVSENTVICQVLVPCLETFWVKDMTTGKILQGDANERLVLHLVRFEQTTKTYIVPSTDKTSDSMSSRFFPFRHELGEWKITDIDDLCDGNLLL